MVLVSKGVAIVHYFKNECTGRSRCSMRRVKVCHDRSLRWPFLSSAPLSLLIFSRLRRKTTKRHNDELLKFYTLAVTGSR